MAIRVAIGAAFTWFAYDTADAYGLVFSAPVWGLLLARPLFELGETLTQSIKQSAWEETGIERHSFGGDPVRVTHIDGFVWIVDTDLLAILGEKPSEQSRRRAHPARYARLPGNRLWGYSEDAVLSLLASSRHRDAHKLRLYLERQVFLPARRKREDAALRSRS